jgi:hypothetical protein
MIEDTDELKREDMSIKMLVVGLLVNELFYAVVFVNLFSTVYHLLFTLLLVFVGICMGGFGAQLQLQLNPWIRRQWFEWYNFFTTRHYLAWLYDKDRRAWLKLIILFSYSMGGGITFILLAQLSSPIRNLADTSPFSFLLLILGSVLFSFFLTPAIWALWNMTYREKASD